MKRNVLYVMIIVLIAMVLQACSNNGDEEDILETLKQEEKAQNEGDLDLLMDTQSSVRQTDSFKELLEESLVNSEDMGFTIDYKDLEVVYINNDEALVNATYDFKSAEVDSEYGINQRMHSYINMVQEDKEWKILQIFSYKNETLNEDGTETTETVFDESETWSTYIQEIVDNELTPSKYLLGRAMIR